MPGSLARPPRHEHSDRGVGDLQRSSQRSWREIMAATPSAQPRLWRRGHHPVGYGDGGAAQCSRPNGQVPHRIWRRRRGCRGHPAGEAAKTPPQAPRRGAEAPARSCQSRSSQRGLDRLGDARWRWRRTAARPTNHSGQMDALGETKRLPRMATAQLAGIGRRSRRRFEIAREGNGLGLGLE
jgi:hypothetical protein